MGGGAAGTGSARSGRAQGAAGIRVLAGGVAWRGSLRDLYDANLRLRVASRVLVRVARFEARAFSQLERRARAVDWAPYLDAGTPVRLNVTCRRSKLYHQRAVAERVIEAIGTAGGIASDDDDPDDDAAQLFVVRFDRDRCTISADASGALLHRRGYRVELAKAPLRETLAAAMLLATGWPPDAPLLDPMCGSGTIPIEAALLARRIAPGLACTPRRRFAFESWPGYDAKLMDEVVAAAAADALPVASAPIVGSDRDAGAVRAAAANADRAGVSADVVFEKRPLSAAQPRGENGWIVTNPPYGARVGESRALRDLYAAVGNLVRRRAPGWTVAWLSADSRLDAQMSLPFEDVLRTRNGGIAVRLLVARANAAGA